MGEPGKRKSTCWQRWTMATTMMESSGPHSASMERTSCIEVGMVKKALNCVNFDEGNGLDTEN